MLLAASVFFYAALSAPLLIVAWSLVVVVSYWCGRKIASSSDESTRKRLLWTGIAVNVVILCGLKYLRYLVGFVVPSMMEPSAGNPWFLTLGVSYYTLQAISYLADLYMGMVEPEPHFGRFALYLGFFPKMLQGPIERGGDLLPQLQAPPAFRYENVRSGLLLFGLGLFKKLAVANRVAPFVNGVYYDPHHYGGAALIVATYMYAIQIYADFSGYTDMALGVARMFNIRLTQNFNAPYLATSVADFWRRWHISFSRWILDYIFKPLQMEWRNARNLGIAAALMVTFVFSGMWHGVNFHFVVWGTLHGAYMAIAVLFRPWRNVVYDAIGLKNKSVRRAIQVVITFNLIAFAWIFFRANSLSDGWYIATHLLSADHHLSYASGHMGGLLGRILDPLLLDKSRRDFALMALSVCLMAAANLMKPRLRLMQQPLWMRWSLYYGLVLALIFLSAYNNVGFIYFQF